MLKVIKTNYKLDDPDIVHSYEVKIDGIGRSYIAYDVTLNPFDDSVAMGSYWIVRSKFSGCHYITGKKPKVLDLNFDQILSLTTEEYEEYIRLTKKVYDIVEVE